MGANGLRPPGAAGGGGSAPPGAAGGGGSAPPGGGGIIPGGGGIDGAPPRGVPAGGGPIGGGGIGAPSGGGATATPSVLRPLCSPRTSATRERSRFWYRASLAAMSRGPAPTAPPADLSPARKPYVAAAAPPGGAGGGGIAPRAAAGGAYDGFVHDTSFVFLFQKYGAPPFLSATRSQPGGRSISAGKRRRRAVGGDG